MQSKWTNKKFRFYIFFLLPFFRLLMIQTRKWAAQMNARNRETDEIVKLTTIEQSVVFTSLKKKMKMRESRRLVRDILEQHTTTSLYNFNTTTETIMNNRRAWGNEVAISSFLLHISLFSPWRTCSLSHWESLKDPFSWEHGTTLLHCM